MSSALSTAVNFNKEYSFTILAVSHSKDGDMYGGVAHIYLTIKPGTGSVFIQSYPTAKVDTQVATRLAKEIACEFSEENCDNYDFFYTIRADAPLVGGPSAGGATALLTLSALVDVALRDDVAMTGAISSGGVIVPVAGIPEKVSSASKNNIKLVIIPKLNILSNETKKVLDTVWESVINESKNSSNKTISIKKNISVKSSKPLSINKEDLYSPFVNISDLQSNKTSVVPVMNLLEALRYASKKKLPEVKNHSISVPKIYSEKMKETAELLCKRTKSLMDEILLINKTKKILLDDELSDLWAVADEKYNRSFSLQNEGHFYPKASYCYSANTNLRMILLHDKNQTFLKENLIKLKSSLRDVERQIENISLRTFSDVETYAIVKERLLEANDILSELNSSAIDSDVLSNAIERYYSAIAWSGFFGLPGQKLMINRLSLQRACSKEIENVETRLNYLKIAFPEQYLESVEKNLQHAYDYSSKEQYALCLFKATKTKADENLRLSTLLIQNSTLEDLISEKQRRTETILYEEQEKGIFPILGYSYYDYVDVLKKDDLSSAMSFSEYALALSDVKDYFPEYSSKNSTLDYFGLFEVAVFFVGFFIGLFVMFLFLSNRLSHPK